MDTWWQQLLAFEQVLIQRVSGACADAGLYFPNSPSGLFFMADIFVVIEEIIGFVK
ncbi:hypothetical protein [Limnohabitans sp. MMS-10A-192]|uniref:hypothetical protein n=1 Tax=Limnohabitans sp. MMS-10A-192 TaxID=1835769 RepID=UPI001E4AD63F|nr:hypothetical protein [Limnohabitans sp. MMS-10A-192]